jgi:hypothetical protein
MAISAKVLVIGGGGGGGGSATSGDSGYHGGGGGAGEYNYDDSVSLTVGLHSIVVGLGGAGGTSSGNNGGASSFLTFSSNGGGGGGGFNSNGSNGASGGGGGGKDSGTSTGGTGTDGYDGGGGQVRFGGGGGGSASAGGYVTAGAGTSNSISGSSVTYTTGGAGGNAAVTTDGANGSTYGSGGGGSSTFSGGGGSPGAGASGVVIIRYATADASSYSIRGGTVTTDGTDTIRTFTKNGTLSIAPLTGPKITSIEAWGAGGTGVDVSSTNGAGGGGGGAYAGLSNLYLDVNSDYTFPVVVGGVGTPSSIGGSLLYADYGRNSSLSNGGAGGQASASSGDVVYSGGNGGNGNTVGDVSAGGGGAGGPDGNGISALNCDPNGSPTNGGAGNNGSGGAGGTSVTLVGADNALGGGGGYGAPDNVGGNAGGFPGGGGGGGNAGDGVGANGVVKIKYVTDSFGTCTGGTKTTDGIYTIHTFTSSGDFFVPKTVPELTTQAVTDIDLLSATLNGTVVSDGGLILTEKGFVYSTSENPTIADTKVIVPGASLGAYTGSATGLTANTTYYVKAYGTNASGTSYGEQVSFTTLEPSAKTLYKDISGIEGQQYTVSLNVGGSAGSVTVKLGSTSTPHVINAGAGVTVFTDIYSGLSGLSIEASDGFIGTIDDVFYVLTIGTPVIDWNIDSLTSLFPINSSVTFKRIEDKEITRFNLYRYLDAQFKDLDGYVTVTILEEKNDLSYSKSKQFLVGNTGTTVSPFVKKRISMLSKNQAILITLSNNKLNETFTICQYSLTGFKEPRKLYKLSKIISI